jgi:hypothetical protein
MNTRVLLALVVCVLLTTVYAWSQEEAPAEQEREAMMLTLRWEPVDGESVQVRVQTIEGESINLDQSLVGDGHEGKGFRTESLRITGELLQLPDDERMRLRIDANLVQRLPRQVQKGNGASETVYAEQGFSLHTVTILRAGIESTLLENVQGKLVVSAAPVADAEES